MSTSAIFSRIAGSGSCLPPRVVTNEQLAAELGSRGITVNCIAPGFIETDMTAALSPEQQQALLTQIPLGHLGRPQDIAEAVAFLAGAQAAYITGQEIHVNGGMYM